MMRGSTQPVRVLVTGFGPFPGIPYNASASLVRGLADAAPAPGLEIATVIIPVVWASAREAAREAAAQFAPHAILHFGVAKRAAGFEVEARAFNRSGLKEDHAGIVRASRPLVRAGRPALSSTLPAAALVRALRKNGYPATVSRDAGRYLCNALFYWSLNDSEAKGRLVGFIHMPAFGVETEVKPRLTMEEAAGGARILLRASAEAVLRARQTRLGERGGGAGHGSQALYRNGRSSGRLGGVG
jgi:pyroglutamyl-peptidase